MSRPPAATRSALEAALVAARPRALGALTRSLRDLDAAEEAFQEASLRALRSWPEQGLPRDPLAWLIRVARNAAIDTARRSRRLETLPETLDLAAAAATETALVEALDRRQTRDDVLHLLFLCCRPELEPAQQIALALRLGAGLSVAEIARAFLLAPKAMEQRITRAKRRIAAAGIAFETPSEPERRQRLAAVTAMIYLIFNEGYSASGGAAHVRAQLCDEAIRLARLLHELFPEEVEVMGLLALCLLQHARRSARLDGAGEIVLLDAQDRALWDREQIAEGLALVENALRRRAPGPLQVQAAIAAVHTRAHRAGDTDWAEIDRLYAVLERLQPSPVVTLNRAVAIAKTCGPAAALRSIEPLAETLDGYFHFQGVRAALLAEMGDAAAARPVFERALELARTPAEAAHLRRQLDRLGRDGEKNLGTDVGSAAGETS